MTSIRLFATGVVLLALVGCDVGKPPSPTATPQVGASNSTSGMEFSGERACADCDGIESWLRLEQSGKTQRYRMVEVYLGQGHERRFEDTGQWSAQGDLLRLRSSQGGERTYARMDGGVLQARGAHGQRIPAVEDDVLEPARFDHTR
ncbi:MAG: copper resistance protein NlpE N-terminal domain-containing protein [Thermomonas sp.]